MELVTGIIPQNLPRVQIPSGRAMKCVTARPSNYILPNNRKVAVEKLKNYRKMYNLMMNGIESEPNVDVGKMRDVSNDLIIAFEKKKSAQTFINTYNALADALVKSYAFDICNSPAFKNAGTGVHLKSVINQLSLKLAPKASSKGKRAVAMSGIGDHLFESSHRLHGIGHNDVINLVVGEIKKGANATEAEINGLVQKAKNEEQTLALANCPKCEVSSGSSKTAGGKDKESSKSEFSWYHNPIIMLTLGVGATIGVQQIIKRSRGA